METRVYGRRRAFRTNCGYRVIQSRLRRGAPAAKLQRPPRAAPTEFAHKDTDLKITRLAALLGALFCGTAFAAVNPASPEVMVTGSCTGANPQNQLTVAYTG